MATQRLGLIMHGVTGRMGMNQHLIRSIVAIRNQGGVLLSNGDRVMPDPILIGRNAEKIEALFDPPRLLDIPRACPACGAYNVAAHVDGEEVQMHALVAATHRVSGATTAWCRGCGAEWTGVQLHDLATAVRRWRDDYGQEVFLRQLSPEIDRAQEDAALKAVARLNGVPYPVGSRALRRWARGRGDGYQPRKQRGQRVTPEEAICSETVAILLQDMGVLEDDRKPHWFDPGTFWSGDYLPLRQGWTYGAEVAVGPPLDPDRVVPSARDRWR